MNKSKKYSWLKELVDEFIGYFAPFVLNPPFIGNWHDVFRIENQPDGDGEIESNLEWLNTFEQELAEELNMKPCILTESIKKNYKSD